MRAVGVFPEQQRIDLVEHPAPPAPGPDAVTLRMDAVGLCGTDREIAAFSYGQPPADCDYLVPGHESLGTVIDVGERVEALRSGDAAVVMVRRPCDDPACAACRADRADFCYTGRFSERGILGAHGFLTERVVEAARYVVPVPRRLADVGVLIEPLTIAEKALIQLYDVQERLPWACTVRPGKKAHHCHRAVVLGAGPVGLLGAMRLCEAGFETYVYSKEPTDSEKAAVTRAVGGTYISAQDRALAAFTDELGQIDFVYEAAGAARIGFELLARLGTNGVFCFTGVPGRKAPIELDADTIMRRLVLRNQVVFGTVNAGRPAYEAAVRSLDRFMRRWPDAVRRLITARHAIDDTPALLRDGWDGIKHVIQLPGDSR